MNQKSHAPTRICAVCRAPSPKEDLVRWVRDEQGEIVPDLLGRSFGRGAWVHPRQRCMEKLIPGLSRSFKAPIITRNEEARRRLVQGAQHRANQLLGSASRQKSLVFGGDACEEGYNAGKLSLLIVATDGRAALSRGFVQHAITSGQACAWGTKEFLGQLSGRSEVAVVGVADRGLAQRLFGAIAMALLDPALGDCVSTTGSENELSSEVE